MSDAPLRRVLRQIKALAGFPGRMAGSDQQLLESFLGDHDQTAFAELMQRHGPMVLGLCRRLLGNPHDAEDAFQATFLVLVRRGRSIRKRHVLASWLYAVAYRVALDSRAGAVRRRAYERRAEAMPSHDPADQAAHHDLRRALDEELERLPEKYRAPLILCYLEGKTTEEAARLFGWPRGTVAGRLARARRMLRARLVRRGLTLSAVSVTTVLSSNASLAGVPAVLAETTLKAAAAMAARKLVVGAISVEVSALIEGALKSLLLTRLKITVAVILMVSAVGTGLLAHRALAERQPSAPLAQPKGTPMHTDDQALPEPAGVTRKPAPTRDNPSSPEEKQTTVVGRVIDPEGRPVAGAQVVVMASEQRSRRGGDLEDEVDVLGRAQTSDKGDFSLIVSLAGSSRFREAIVLATSPGFGLAWQTLQPRSEQPEVVVRLAAENIIHGRFVDVRAQPASGVTVRVAFLGNFREGSEKGARLETAKTPPVWPGPAVTDSEGRFTLRGIGPGLDCRLEVNDLRFARQWFPVTKEELGKEFNRTLQPSQLIEGTVTYADTGRPAPHTRLTVYAREERFGGGVGMSGRADEHGRFQLNPFPGKFFAIAAYGPDGEPYLALSKEIEWPAGAAKQEISMVLQRGVLVRGKITVATSGQPMAGASVQFIPRSTQNPHLRQDVLSGWQSTVLSGKHGVFWITVLPGPGHLLIHAPTEDFVYQEIGSNQVSSEKPGGVRNYAHGIVRIDTDQATMPASVGDIALRPGTTIKGRLLGPDNKPVGEALMISRLHVYPVSPHWRGVADTVRDGRFELHGCDPEKTYPVFFLEPQQRWGAAVQVNAKAVGGQPFTVRMSPCGSAAARVVDSDRKPMKNVTPPLQLVVTPGPDVRDREALKKGALAADSDFVANIDRLNHWREPGTDAEGRLTWHALIPGASYRIALLEGRGRDFSVEAGKTLDLGEIMMKSKP